MTNIKVFTFNPFMENTYVLYDESGEGVVIDPGCYEKHEQDALRKYIADHNIQVVALLNTHCHVDHILGNHFVQAQYGVKLYVHKESAPVLKANEAIAPAYGFHQYQPATPDVMLAEGEVVAFGDTSLQVLYVPGHAPGHIAFWNARQRFCIAGDVLFQGSIGRTDLPGGDMDTLLQSIHQKIFPLGDDVVVYPGHGPSTMVGVEKAENPFCSLRA
jgi:glyoxylase-like metal-dependent hydrolase (beta-lactamase superfamily II)